MTGIDQTAFRRIYPFIVWPDGFQQSMLVFPNKAIGDFVDAVGDHLIIDGIVIDAAHILTDIEHDHDNAVPFVVSCPGIDLGRKAARCCVVMVEAPEYRYRLLTDFLLACCDVKLHISHNGKCFREIVAPVDQGTAVSGHTEVHMAVFVKAMGIEKIVSRAGNLKPLRLMAELVVKLCKHPGTSSLLPDGFVFQKQIAVPIKAAQKSAVFRVRREFFPEWYKAVHQGIVNLLTMFRKVLTHRTSSCLS